jgi:hypothetical protein
MRTRAIPAELAASLHEDVARHGALDVETGMFLLARDEQEVACLALAGKRGITRRRDRFAASGKALARLFRYAAEQELTVVAQIHSHSGHAFLSPVDLRHGFAVEGFLTSVVPNYRHAPRDPAAWGWWQYTGGSWQPSAAYRIDDSANSAAQTSASVISFDEDGIDAR